MSELKSFQFATGGRVWTCTEDRDSGEWRVASDCGVYVAEADLTDHLEDQVAALLGKLCPLIHAMGEAKGAENMAQVLSAPRISPPIPGAERENIWRDIVKAGQRIALSHNPEADRPDPNTVVGILAWELSGMPIAPAIQKQIDALRAEAAEVAA